MKQRSCASKHRTFLRNESIALMCISYPWDVPSGTFAFRIKHVPLGTSHG
jgi:hypothetical protein